MRHRFGLPAFGLPAIAAVLVLTLAQPVLGQPVPRQLTFAAAAADVVQNNLQLRAAAFEVAVAQAQLATARGGKAPQVALTASYTRSQEQAGQTISVLGTPVTLPPPLPEVAAVGVGAQYPLYTGGALEAQIALAEANLRGAEAVLERTKRQVVFFSQQAYLTALLALESLGASRRALEQSEENLRVAQARARVGAAPAFDVLQAEVAVAGRQQEVVRAQSAVQNAFADLNALLNQPLDTPLELTDALEPRPVAGTLDAVIAQALRGRPEIAELRARMDAARIGIELAQSGARPDVVLSAGYDVSGSPSTMSGAWSVTLAATLLVSDGGTTRERVREAELRLEQLNVLEAQTTQRIVLDVRQAWLALEQAAAELVAASTGVQQGREAARIAGLRYQAGVGTSLEVVSAQSALAQAELVLASARFHQNLAAARLMLAAGGSL